MRRRFFFILTVLSVPGWSQPAQQPAQAPIVVKVEMPPTNPWLHLIEIVVPGIIGAGLALFGVWLTNKRNAAENAANRQHAIDIERTKDEIAAEAKSRDSRWNFQKDIYYNLIKATSDMIRLNIRIVDLERTKNAFHSDGAYPEEFQQMREQAFSAHDLASETFVTYCNLAPLAMADDVNTLAQKVRALFTKRMDFKSPECESQLNEMIDALKVLIQALQAAGRKDLWDTPEPEATVESAT
jgi:hypothetical protein